MFGRVATLDWLWGVLAGAVATYAGTELRERRRHRRTIDGAAIDLARDLLEEVELVDDELGRAEDYRSYAKGMVMGEIVTAQLRDRLGRAAGHVEARMGDPPLSEHMRAVYEEMREARDAARDYDAAPNASDARHWEDSPDVEQTAAFERVRGHVQDARGSAKAALARIAELERERPRR